MVNRLRKVCPSNVKLTPSNMNLVASKAIKRKDDKA
jgi:hypothetical protein